MRSRIFVGAIVACLALAGSAVALGGSSERKVPAPTTTGTAAHPPKSLAKVQRALARATQNRVRCRSIRCINRSLNQLATAFNTLNQCLNYVTVGRFGGYLYSNDGGATVFQTSALDEVDPGQPGRNYVYLVC